MALCLKAQRESLIDALRLLLLSYNASHSTLLTRVVAKHGQKDLIVSGAQSGVLYVPGLPVEKNVFAGVERKISTFSRAFRLTAGSRSVVSITNASSTAIDLPLMIQLLMPLLIHPLATTFLMPKLTRSTRLGWESSPIEQKKRSLARVKVRVSMTIAHLMLQIFGEVSRVLKPDGTATVVFHASKPAVWKALGDAFDANGLNVERSSVLDKRQPSF